MPHCPMKFRYVRGRLASAAPRILDIGCGNGSPTLTKRWFPGCHYAGADIQRYNLSDADVAAMDEFYPARRGWIGLRCDSGGELRFRDSESRGGAHAGAGSDCGQALRQAQAGRIYLDCISIGAKFAIAAFCGRDAEFLRRSHACLPTGSGRDRRAFCWRMEWTCSTRADRERGSGPRLRTW